MRTYERTHPWISFCVDLERVDARTWMHLGEAQSKCEHVAGALLRPAVAERLHRVYLAKGALATTAIEGNTLSETEVAKIMDGTLRLPPSKGYLEREIKNVLGLLNRLGEEQLRGTPSPLGVDALKEMNLAVLEGLPLGEGVVPGETRAHSVGVGRYRGAPAEDCEHLLGRLAEFLGDQPRELLGGDRISTAIVRSVLAHLHIAWIHPFGDGNGRTARAVEFSLLLEGGVPTPAAHLLSNHYNETRSEYYRHLDLASRTDQGPYAFLGYAVQGFVDQLAAQIAEIRTEQTEVFWRDFVYEQFREEVGEASRRRRSLVLELSRRLEPVPASAIPGLSPELTARYAGKTTKTLTRDLNALIELGLLRRRRAGYVAAVDRIEAFLPARRTAD